MLVAQDGLHRLNVACRCQHASSQGAPSTVRAAELDTGLAVEPADRLLPNITGPVHLGAALKFAELESQLEGLALVRHHQSGVGAKSSELNPRAEAPSTPLAHGYPLLNAGEALHLCQVDIACPTSLRNLSPQINLGADRAAGGRARHRLPTEQARSRGCLLCELGIKLRSFD